MANKGAVGLPLRPKTTDASARLIAMSPMTMIAVPITDSARIKRMTEFASDIAQLADQRPELDLRVLIDDLYRDLMT